MSIRDLILQLSLINLTPSLFLNQTFIKIIATDSPELALQKIDTKTLWITAIKDPSILSVAYFKKAVSILLTEADVVDPVLIHTAIEKQILLLSSHDPAFSICGKLYCLINHEN